MRLGTNGFVGGRLIEAREATGLTATALAELVQVTRQAISQYENGTHSPGADVLERMSICLGVPQHRFLKPLPACERSAIFFRSMSTATKMARTRASRRLDRVAELAEHVEEFVDLPPVDLPDLNVPDDPLQLSNTRIEALALELRRAWGLGDGPISNLMWLLENHGFIVARAPLDSSTLDGLSAWINDRPFILINEDVPGPRALFDVAHELAHVVLHRTLSEKSLKNSGLFRFVEKQAHRFAAAFVFPETSFAREAVPISLERFIALKKRWRLSVKMMIHRTSDLSLASEERLTQLYRQYSWRKWSSGEPLDDTLPPEQPRLLDKCTSLLIESGAKTDVDFVHELALHEGEIARLAGMTRDHLQARNAVVLPFRVRA